MEHGEDIRPPRFDVVALGRQCVIVKLLKLFKTGTCIWTMLATHLTTMSLTVPHLLFFIMCSKGLDHKLEKYFILEKSPEEIFLEVEIWQLSLLDEFLGQLSEEWLHALCFTLQKSSVYRADPKLNNIQYLRESTAKKEISWTVFTPTKLKCSPRT